MFWIRHPRPLLSTKAVATQVVARKSTAPRDLHVIVVESRAPAQRDDAALPAAVSKKGTSSSSLQGAAMNLFDPCRSTPCEVE
jgi:hypothetical protein